MRRRRSPQPPSARRPSRSANQTGGLLGTTPTLSQEAERQALRPGVALAHAPVVAYGGSDIFGAQGDVLERVFDLVGNRAVRASLVKILGALHKERFVEAQPEPRLDHAPNLVIEALDRMDGLPLWHPKEGFVWRRRGIAQTAAPALALSCTGSTASPANGSLFFSLR